MEVLKRWCINGLTIYLNYYLLFMGCSLNKNMMGKGDMNFLKYMHVQSIEDITYVYMYMYTRITKKIGPFTSFIKQKLKDALLQSQYK